MESFTETRSVSYEYASYPGGAVDGPDRGPIPDPWQVDFKSNQLFAAFTRKAPIPHTEQIIVIFFLL